MCAAGLPIRRDFQTRGASRYSSSSPSRVWLEALSRTGCLTDQVVALGHIRGSTGGIHVRGGGGGEVAAELVQVAADRVPTVSLPQHFAKTVGFAQPGGGAVDVADRDRAPEHRGGILPHRIVGEG